MVTNKARCLELIEIIERDYYDSLPCFYKNLYEILMDFMYQFENNVSEEDETET